MAGLTVTALIEYSQEHPDDPRILPSIEQALEQLWQWAWIPEARSFWINNGPGRDLTHGSPDLNQLIAPGYAWLYAQTGEEVWKDRAVAIFNGGVTRACTGCDGKHFSQQYRDSFETVRWLTTPSRSR